MIYFSAAGQRGDGRGEPIDADDVCLRWTGDGRFGRVRLWRVRVCVGGQRATGVEVVEASELGFQPGLGLLYGWMWGSGDLCSYSTVTNNKRFDLD